ncbi:prepilin peptidase [Actinobacillus genomosp. 2]|uniref:prepilin peptidase n=1 Tax=Actinobacillus genomosp. 2 TaxID=230709 RepID=UPI002441522E|nr:prepilin peptidase [Actinobacillus genomosp. 2]WGE32462.1 prepilin peptidase [Actinobacillus genomosp. 2]
MLIFALSFAWWCKQAIPKFADKINRQVYDEYYSLLDIRYCYHDFRHSSRLQPKITAWGNLFYGIFPLIAWRMSDPILALLFMILAFLSVLDYCYYLTDIQYVASIFILSLLFSLDEPHQISLLFCCVFFSVIGFFTQKLLKKEILGGGDSLLFIALSPLFTVDELFGLLLFSSLFGIGFMLIYRLYTQKILRKLAFIPFISISTFFMIIDKINT